MKFNSVNIILFISFVALPVAGLMLHLKIHPNYGYLTWILLFDIVIVSLLYLFESTKFYGFAINSVLFLVGVVMHITYVPGGGISDIVLAIPDFCIGYALWRAE